MKSRFLPLTNSKPRLIILIVTIGFLFSFTSTAAQAWPWGKKEIASEDLQEIISELRIYDDSNFSSYNDVFKWNYTDSRELLDALNKEVEINQKIKKIADVDIDQKDMDGLTYGRYILNAINERKLVERCIKIGSPNPSGEFFGKLANGLADWKPELGKFLLDKVLESVFVTIGSPGLSIGISSLGLATNLTIIGLSIKKLNDTLYEKALWSYMNFRKYHGFDHDDAWGATITEPYINKMVVLSSKKKQQFKEKTEINFKCLWKTYGDHVSAEQLEEDFKAEQRKKLKVLFLYALGARPHLIISSPLKITPPPYKEGNEIKAEFTIENIGDLPIFLKTVTVGGRYGDRNEVIDFTKRHNIGLDVDGSVDGSYEYHGTLTLTRAGNYHFFCAYQTPDGKWNPSIDLGAGLTDEDRIEDILVTLNNVALGKPCTIITNGAEDYSDGHPGEWPRDITDGSLAYQPVSSGKKDGCIAWQNKEYDELLIVTVTIDLGASHNITKIRYNPGNCERAETWNADIMESPFGRTPTNSGSTYRGTWTEQTGNITTSKVTIKLEKTRRSWATDWLFIGEIEVWETPMEQKFRETTISTQFLSLILRSSVGWPGVI